MKLSFEKNKQSVNYLIIDHYKNLSCNSPELTMLDITIGDFYQDESIGFFKSVESATKFETFSYDRRLISGAKIEGENIILYTVYLKTAGLPYNKAIDGLKGYEFKMNYENFKDIASKLEEFKKKRVRGSLLWLDRNNKLHLKALSLKHIDAFNKKYKCLAFTSNKTDKYSLIEQTEYLKEKHPEYYPDNTIDDETIFQKLYNFFK